MYSNFTKWDILTAANDVARSHDSDPPTPGLIEGVSGAAVAVVFLIGIVIAVRKYLETVQVVLERFLSVLTMITNAIRKRLPTTTPPPPPNEPRERNYTDDEIIEMREQMERIYGQIDQGASRSVWI